MSKIDIRHLTPQQREFAIMQLQSYGVFDPYRATGRTSRIALKAVLSLSARACGSEVFVQDHEDGSEEALRVAIKAVAGSIGLKGIEYCSDPVPRGSGLLLRKAGGTNNNRGSWRKL